MANAPGVSGILLLSAVPLGFALFAPPALTQSLSGLRIGDDAVKLSSFGIPSDTDQYKSFVVRKWTLPSGNDLSVTTSKEGKIVYLESDWNGKSDDSSIDIPGIRLGKTTLGWGTHFRWGAEG